MKRFLTWLTATSERRLCLALLALCAIMYIPLAGNYGMWDPWETHYGEVAQQMATRGDWISLWWPGSPQDRAEFWSKPVLSFWLMALAMKAAGLNFVHAAANQMVRSWRVEWACRMPFILLSISAIWSVWEVTRRLVSKRAGALAAVVLATSAQWVFITRQAMTDMAFVAPMTIALALGALALLLPEEERERELPRRSFRGLSWPHARAFYWFLGLFVVTTLPQLIDYSIQLQFVIRLGKLNIRCSGIVAMIPYFAAFFGALWWCARARNLRQVYLFSAYVLCGLATLAKGPAGLAMPALVLAIYLVIAGRWKDILFKLEIPRGALLFVANAFPWYHAMLIRHGMGFWNEFIGDNYVHRAEGRNGDRGVFDYYIQYIAYGMFPWSGIVTLGGLFSFKWLRSNDKRRGLIGLALVWFLVDFTVVSLVNTKFHHYILPALPALAILAGILLDEVLEAPQLAQALGLLFVATPITFFSGRDLAALPARLLWMFNYDYVNSPGTGRPWPSPSIYGTRYEYGAQLLAFAVVAALATAALGAFVAWKRSSVEEAIDVPPARDYTVWWLLAFAIAMGASIASGPATPNGAAPVVARLAWLVPAALMIPFALLVARLSRRAPGLRPRSAALLVLGLLSVVWTAFVADKLLIELSPHWSQKHVIAAYYAQRKGPGEKLIAWQLYWRGENFYTQNEIYRDPNPAERTVFLDASPQNSQRMQQYFAKHPGRRVFFVVERTRYETLRQLLPPAARPTMTVVDRSNNKLYLAVATLPPAPAGPAAASHP